MFKFLKERKKDNKGFTLVELVIVVAILAILVGILAPQYTKYVERSRKSADAANLDNLVTAVKVAAADQSFSKMIPSDADKDVVISIGKDKTEIKYDNVAIAAGNDAKGALYAALQEYAGNAWADTKLKSNAWKNNKNDATSTIKATCKIKTSGAVEVTYDPTAVKNSVKED